MAGRKTNCNGYGSLCYDPRFVGGDGVMFYFHGSKGGNFAVVSDNNLQINAHLIGTRPQGRSRDFTWVQALSVMYDSQSLVVAAKRVSVWDDAVDAFTVKFDGIDVDIPVDGEAEWRKEDSDREVIIERTDDTNNLRISVSGIVEINVKVILFSLTLILISLTLKFYIYKELNSKWDDQNTINSTHKTRTVFFVDYLYSNALIIYIQTGKTYWKRREQNT